MPRILLIEDNPDLSEALQRNLEIEGYQVAPATNAAQALALARSRAPDLVVTDINLPDRDGYAILQELRARGLLCPVLILSARQLEADKVLGFRLGADDYVTKPFSVMELLARIGALLRRATITVPPSPGGPAERPLPSDTELRARYGLTARQVAVMRLLAEGFTNAEIAQRLSVSYYTARNHVEQVLSKLGVPSRAAVGAVLYGNAECGLRNAE